MGNMAYPLPRRNDDGHDELVIADQIINRTSASMKLEDQENKPDRLQKAVKAKAEEIRIQMPKYLWD